MSRFAPSIIFILAFFSMLGSSATLFHGGAILTMDGKQPTAESVLVVGDSIRFVGSLAEGKRLAPKDAKLMDLKGKVLLPGFVEGHGHLLWTGIENSQLCLKDAKSLSQLLSMVKSAVSSDRRWILGNNYNEIGWNDLSGKLHKKHLDQVSTDHPIFLNRGGQHAAWVNSKALQIAGITRDTQDPEGGAIDRDSSGEPTGMLLDNAVKLVSSLIPPPSIEQKVSMIVETMSKAAALGITTFVDAGATLEEMKLYQGLAKDHRLPIRLYQMAWNTDKKAVREVLQQKTIIADHRYISRSIKVIVDGSLGSGGAALEQGYTDDPSNKGILLEVDKNIAELAEKCLEQGVQLNAHAIGDRANHLVLSSFREAMRKFPNRDHRFRIEHAQLVSPSDIQLFQESKIIASIQGTHCTSDQAWIADKIGHHRAHQLAFPWRSFLRAGVLVVGGSDTPVESMNPFWGMDASIYRTGADHVSFNPSQAMQPEEALRSYTIDSAFSIFMDRWIGSIETGKYADLVVIDQHPIRSPRSIKRTQVILTMLGGTIIHERER